PFQHTQKPPGSTHAAAIPIASSRKDVATPPAITDPLFASIDSAGLYIHRQSNFHSTTRIGMSNAKNTETGRLLSPALGQRETNHKKRPPNATPTTIPSSVRTAPAFHDAGSVVTAGRRRRTHGSIANLQYAVYPASLTPAKYANPNGLGPPGIFFSFANSRFH